MVNGNFQQPLIQHDMETISNSIFTSFIPNDKGVMKFEHFVCLYASLVSQDPDEKFDLVFRVFALNPPEYDEERKE